MSERTQHLIPSKIKLKRNYSEHKQLRRDPFALLPSFQAPSQPNKNYRAITNDYKT